MQNIRSGLLFFVVTAGFMVSSCGPEVGAAEKIDKKSSLVVESSDSTAACFGLVNGAATDEYKAVGMLLSVTPDGKHVGLCTGTYVSPTTMITAAHCITTDKDGGVLYYPESSLKIASDKDLKDVVAKGIKPLQVFHDAPDIVGKKIAKVTAALAQQDVAILVFPKDTFKDSTSLPPAVRERRPLVSEPATILGYGSTSFKDATAAGETIQKRVGVNSEFFLAGDFNTYILQVAAGSKEAGGSYGDSGGPMIVRNLLTGIFSGSGVDDKTGKALNFYADLTVGRAGLFDRARAAGAEIPVAAKGSGLIRACGGK